VTALLAGLLYLAGPLVRLLWAPLALCGLLLMLAGLREATRDNDYADAEARAWRDAHPARPLPAELVSLCDAATARLSAARFRTARFCLYLAVGAVALLITLNLAGVLDVPTLVLAATSALAALALLAIMASEIAQEVQGRRLGARARRNWEAATRAEGG
jgi:hypothetical protein